VKRLPTLAKMFLVLFCFSIVLSAANAGSVINDVLIIPKVEFNAVIDGEVETEWTFPPVCMSVYSSNNDPIVPVGGALDLSAWYKVAWNDDGIFFFGHVTDDSVVVHSDPTTAQHVTDSWEIFFDGENDKASSYDSNDVQFRWAYDLAEEIGQGTLADEEVAWLEVDGGYDFEVLIPATQLADSHYITLALNKEIGWEVQINDIEEEGTRQNQIKWWEADDASWSTPSLFGTAKLVLSPELGIDEETISNIALSAPAVISAGATVSYNIAARSSVSLELINLAGQVVKVLDSGVKSAGTYNAPLDAAGLANGVYFVNLNACGGSASDKVLLIK